MLKLISEKCCHPEFFQKLFLLKHEPLQRILILTYFFPPCNLTASQRSYSWARYLNEFGIYPVVITRRWDREITNLNDLSFATKDTVKHEIHDGYEVYYVPYEPNLRDRIYARFGEKQFSNTRKLLSFFEVILQDIFVSFIPFRNLYFFAKKYLKKNPGIRGMIISGNPFVLFKFGFLLNKKFKIPWVADYRDAWSTSEINTIIRGKLFGVINNFEISFEKKWTGSAAAITAVSAPILKNIQTLTGITRGFVLQNGYVEEEIPSGKNNLSDSFTITYVRTLFNGQPIEIFAGAFRKFIAGKSPKDVQLLFPGLAFYPDQEKRLLHAFKGLESYLHVTPRMPRQNVLGIEHRSHLLLHFAWKGYHGIVASKIYEYIGIGRPILICPSDEDEVEKILRPYNLALLCHDESETLRQLENHFSIYRRKNYSQINADKNFQIQFSRREQVRKLSLLFNDILN